MAVIWHRLHFSLAWLQCIDESEMHYNWGLLLLLTQSQEIMIKKSNSLIKQCNISAVTVLLFGVWCHLCKSIGIVFHIFSLVWLLFYLKLNPTVKCNAVAWLACKVWSYPLLEKVQIFFFFFIKSKNNHPDCFSLQIKFWKRNPVNVLLFRVLCYLQITNEKQYSIFFPSHISSFVTWLHFNLALNLLHIKHRKNKVTIKDMGIIYCSYHLYIQFELQNKVDIFFSPVMLFFGLLFILGFYTFLMSCQLEHLILGTPGVFFFFCAIYEAPECQWIYLQCQPEALSEHKTWPVLQLFNKLKLWQHFPASCWIMLLLSRNPFVLESAQPLLFKQWHHC